MVKKFVIGGSIAVVVLCIGWGVIALKAGKFSLGDMFFNGKQEPVTRGDLTIPITATGTIESARLIQIKSKASGVVQELPVSEGQPVKKGDKLIVLDPVDEKRNVQARQAQVDRTKSAWEKAKIALDNQVRDLPLQTKLSQARLKDATARFKNAEYSWNRIQKMDESVKSDLEIVSTEAAYLTAEANKDQAEFDLERAKNNESIILNSAKEDVVQATAAYEEAVKQLEEAQQRLKETTILSPLDTMVYSIHTSIGETIQGGTATFTGGTVLIVLADVNSMFVMAQVDEADIGAIRKIAPKHARPGLTERYDDSVYKERAEKAIEASDKGETLDEKTLEMLGRPVDITVDAYRDQKYQGVIERILPEPQKVNNAVSFKVRIRLVGEDLQKLMGLQADLSFTSETKKNVLLVKNDALVSEGRKCFVYVPNPEEKSGRLGERKVEVEIGMTDGTNTELISGLKEGEQVFVKRPVNTDK